MDIRAREGGSTPSAATGRQEGHSVLSPESQPQTET